MAWIVLRPGFAPGAELAREIQDFVKMKLAAHDYPRHVESRGRFPVAVLPPWRSKSRLQKCQARPGSGGRACSPERSNFRTCRDRLSRRTRLRSVLAMAANDLATMLLRCEPPGPRVASAFFHRSSEGEKSQRQWPPLHYLSSPQTIKKRSIHMSAFCFAARSLRTITSA